MMAPADEVISDITLHIRLLKKCRCDENLAIRGGYGYIMVKSVGCGPGLWVVLLKISWAWNISNDPSKKALILCKTKSILYSILGNQNTPTLHSNTPPKMGYLRCDSRGIYVTGTYP
jgi:hypothetical protein